MTSPTVDENPEPGESGYYDWHKAVAKHHNDKAGVGAHHAASRVSVTTSGLAVVSSTDVQAALADLDGATDSNNTHRQATGDAHDLLPSGSADDLVGLDGSGGTKTIASGTYEKALKLRAVDLLDDLVLWEPFDGSGDLDTATAPSGQAWTVHTGSISKGSNRASASTTPAIATVDLGSISILEIHARVWNTSGTTTNNHVVLFYVDTNNFLYVEVECGSGGRAIGVDLVKREAGSDTVLASHVGDVPPSTLQITRAGPFLTVSIIGNLLFTHQLSSSDQSTYLGATQHGMLLDTTTGGMEAITARELTT